ncbi:MAG: translation initiation factor IF-2, partial [Rhodospirillaceae bacterium]|nr:translation initiation factor IF-2 [Rhodospirillaceae bacterium]
MSESKDKNKGDAKKPLRISSPGKLELKKTVETGQVKQSFSHGRSKMVTVEVRKKRTYAPDSGGNMAEVSGPAKKLAKEAFTPDVKDVFDGTGLTNHEKESRARALEDAKIRAEEEARLAEEEALRKASMPEPEPEPEPEIETAPVADVAPDINLVAEASDEEGATRAKRSLPKRKEIKEKDDRRDAPARPRGEQKRRSGKLTISSVLSGKDGEERQRSIASVKRAREKEKQKQQQARAEGKKIIRDVVVPETISVQELANRMTERGVDVIRALMKMGVMATINQVIDADTAELIVSEFGHNVQRVSESDVELGLGGGSDDVSTLVPRPPVVTIMGHVDHGKTSLLDALRATDIAGGEAGGITQHIGAYQVTIESGQKITFIDTPGHAAFTDMRARGAKVTDIVVLVVAADDSVMPQTIEAIHHAKAASVPIIVAINKCDKPDANAQRVRTELLQHEVVVEEMGGDVLTVEVSAKERLNLDKLEEAILLQAEILDLKANPDCPAEGVIVEAKMEQGRGSVATVLVQRGTLRAGDIFVAGSEWGKVRALIDDHGNQVEFAVPGTPVEVLGLSGTPDAGDEVVAVGDENRAREVTDYRKRKKRDLRSAASGRGTLEQMFERIQEGEAQELPVVIKADVHGSLEAIQAALNQLGTDEVKARILHGAVGGINESDIILARASGGFVIGFNVRANAQARDLAKRDGVDIRYYSIIYDVTDDMKKALSGMLAPTIKENLLGYAQVREVFSVSKVGKVAGCMVSEGTVKRGAKVRLLRDDVVIHEGELSQLKRFKDDAKEVKEGMECGMSFANYDDIKEG